MGIATEKCSQIQEAAMWNFYHGLNCCESVYEAFFTAGILTPEQLPYETCALCAGFGGGMGMSGNSCGALSGAILAVGARHGRRDPKGMKPDGLYDLEYRRYNNLVHEFSQRMGSPICREICREHLDDWGGPARKDRCGQAVRAAVEVACKYFDLTSQELAAIPWRENVAGF